MPYSESCEIENAQKVLEQFAESGLRKTSMEDLARAVGVSRQSVYKRFGSKISCYQWAVDTYLGHLFARIFSELKNAERSPKQTLLAVFDIYIGQSIYLVRLPEGISVLKDVAITLQESEHDWLIRFKARLADFLERHAEARPGAHSAGLALLLISAAKGLLLETPCREQFMIELEQLLDSAVSWEH